MKIFVIFDRTPRMRTKEKNKNSAAHTVTADYRITKIDELQ